MFRTLDIGSDKVLPYWNRAPEENPAMGWRAIRIALDRPAMLRQQLRAMLNAAAGAHAVGDVPDGDGDRGVRCLPPPAGSGTAAPGAPQGMRAARERAGRRDGGGAGAALAVAGAAGPGRFPVGRQQRSAAVPVRRRSRQSGGGRAATTRWRRPCGGPWARWRARRSMPASRSGCAARWRAIRSAAMALMCLGYRSLSMAPPRVLPMRAAIRSLDLG